MKSKLIDYSLSSELQNKFIGSMNKLEAVSIPIGVKIFITDVITTDISRAEELTDTLKIKLNDESYAPSQSLYLHSVGTSSERLVVRQTSVSSPLQESESAYFDNIAKQSLALESSVKKILEDTKIANEATKLAIQNLKFERFQNAIVSHSSILSNGFTTILNEIAFYDKIVVKFWSKRVHSEQYIRGIVEVDGTVADSYDDYKVGASRVIIVNGVRDKTITVSQTEGSASDKGVTIEKYKKIGE
jgi:hypothetical protein